MKYVDRLLQCWRIVKVHPLTPAGAGLLNNLFKFESNVTVRRKPKMPREDARKMRVDGICTDYALEARAFFGAGRDA